MQTIPTTITTAQTNTDITTYPIADPNYGIYPSVQVNQNGQYIYPVGQGVKVANQVA